MADGEGVVPGKFLEAVVEVVVETDVVVCVVTLTEVIVAVVLTEFIVAVVNGTVKASIATEILIINTIRMRQKN